VILPLHEDTWRAGQGCEARIIDLIGLSSVSREMALGARA
jgi:hypothetical protein